jgi:hypothetical protein
VILAGSGSSVNLRLIGLCSPRGEIMLVLQKLFLFSLAGLLFFQTATPSKQEPLIALDNTSFRPFNFGGMTFNIEGSKATSMTFKQGQTVNQMKRTGDVSQ